VVVPTHDELVRRYPALADLSANERSLVCVPVSLGEQRLGVISLSFPSDHVFDSSQLRFLTAIGDTCAQALDRARALDRATAATEKLAFLARASSELGRSLDHKETLARLTRLVVPRLADWCAVQVVEDGELVTLAVVHSDPAKSALAAALQERYPPRMDAPTGVPNVIRTGVSELHPSLSQAQLQAGARDEEHLELIRQLGLASALVVPLTGRRGTFGALTLIAAESGRHFDEADLAFAEDLAARAAVAVENAQAFQQQSGQLAAITRIAEAAQQAILAPVPERMGALRLAASYTSAAQDALVGGDLYEAIRRPDSVRLLIG
jgi:GAF domain-containing protein